MEILVFVVIAAVVAFAAYKIIGKKNPEFKEKVDDIVDDIKDKFDGDPNT
ncbi:MAG: hypothetical protein ACR2PH_10345 [Desulfobulbia bacterium]